MKPHFRSTISTAVIFINIIVLSQITSAGEVEIARKVDESAAQRLAAEAVYDAVKYLGFFDYDSSISNKFSPPFLVFNGLSSPPAEGNFGVFAVNPWTGDVWNLWGCHRLSTPALRKSQAAIRKRFTPEELKQYAKLRALKPECVVEN